MHLRKWLTGVAVLAAAAVLFLVFRWWQGPSVAAYRIESRPLVQQLVATGRVIALSRAQVGSEITGVVLERRVQEGDAVQPGDILLVLGSDELSAKVREAEAALAQLQHSTRPQARPFFNHSQVYVNGRQVDIPSYRVRKGDVILLRDKSREMLIVQHNMDTLGRTPPPWLDSADGGQEVTVRELPLREHIDVPVREQLIVELYSK